MLPRPAYDREENVEKRQCQPASSPAAEKFSEHHVTARDRFGQQWKNRAALLFGRQLPRSRRHGDDERRNPDQQQTDLFEIAGNPGISKQIHSSKQERDYGCEKKQDINVLSPNHFQNDETSDGRNIAHRG